jgi:hypothetical protein
MVLALEQGDLENSEGPLFPWYSSLWFGRTCEAPFNVLA